MSLETGKSGLSHDQASLGQGNSFEKHADMSIPHISDRIAPILGLDKSEVESFVYRVGQHGLRIFSLSDEYPVAVQNAIRLSRQLGGEHADRVFAACAELIDASDSTDQYSLKTYEQTLTFADIAECKKILRQRAADFLLRIGRYLPAESDAQIAHYPERAHRAASELREFAERESVGARLFAATFRILKRKHPDMSLESVRGASVETYKGGEIPSGMLESMLQIQSIQYAPKYPGEMTADLHAELVRASENDRSSFYYLRKDGGVVAFVRFVR